MIRNTRARSVLEHLVKGTSLSGSSSQAGYAPDLEIERRFLLDAIPGDLVLTRGTPIIQGYLSCGEHTDVRIRKHGRSFFLTVKEGSGLRRREIEVEITARQFEELWPSTETRRLEKNRAVAFHGAYRVEIDTYEGELAPLKIAEVEFSSVAESEAFVKPDYFGEEITEDETYRNISLAMHGLPVHGQHDYRIAALPYLFRSGSLHLVLVTNSGQNRWILPKGHPETGMSRQDVAVMEAMEEGGIIGTCPPGLRSVCRIKGQRTLHVYPLRVTTLLKKWPEMQWRKRQVLPLNKALTVLRDPELARLIRKLADKIEEG